VIVVAVLLWATTLVYRRGRFGARRIVLVAGNLGKLLLSMLRVAPVPHRIDDSTDPVDPVRVEIQDHPKTSRSAW
jgi:hypothetical protein